MSLWDIVADGARASQETRDRLAARLGREDVELRVIYSGGQCTVGATVDGATIEPVTVEEGVDLLDTLEARVRQALEVRT